MYLLLGYIIEHFNFLIISLITLFIILLPIKNQFESDVNDSLPFDEITRFFLKKKKLRWRSRSCEECNNNSNSNEIKIACVSKIALGCKCQPPLTMYLIELGSLQISFSFLRVSPFKEDSSSELSLLNNKHFQLTRGQFHQRSTGSFYASSLMPIILAYSIRVERIL